MRAALFATVSLAFLAACGEPDSSQSDNSNANSSATASSPTSATTASSNPLGAPVSGDRAKQLMDERHEGMEDIGDAFKVIGREMKSATPNLQPLRQNAATIARLAPLASGWFPPGTEPTVGKTRAKAEVWQKPEDFAAKMRDFQQAAQAFNGVADRGETAALKTTHANLGKACKACHDLYRAPEDEH